MTPWCRSSWRPLCPLKGGTTHAQCTHVCKLQALGRLRKGNSSHCTRRVRFFARLRLALALTHRLVIVLNFIQLFKDKKRMEGSEVPPPLADTDANDEITAAFQITEGGLPEELPPTVVVIRSNNHVYTSCRAVLGGIHTSSLSWGFFERVEGSRVLRYFCKGSMMEPMPCLEATLKEYWGNVIYRHFGVSSPVLDVVYCTWLPGSPLDILGLDSRKGLHIMSQWITELNQFSQQQVAQLVRGNLAEDVDLLADSAVPVKGLGHLLAVALFLNDIDCLGSQGNNFRYTLVSDAATGRAYAQVVNIDTGCSFHRPPSPVSATVQVSPPDYVDITRMPSSVRTEFLQTIDQILRVPGREGDTMATWFDSTPLSVALGEFFRESTGLNPAVVGALRLEVLEFLYSRQDALRAVFGPMLQYLHLGVFTLQNLITCTREHYSVCGRVDPRSGSSVFIAPMLRRVAAQHGNGPQRAGADPSVQDTLSSIADALSRALATGPRRYTLLVLGRPGVGKSQLAHQVTLDWVAASPQYSDFDVVVLVDLRNLNSNRYPDGDSVNLARLAARESGQLFLWPSVVDAWETLLQTTPNQVLWVVDGFDEMKDRIPPHLQLAYDGLMKQPYRVVLSRHLSPGDREKVGADETVEIDGFDDEGVSAYVDSAVPVDACERVEDAIRRHPAKDLLRIPLNLSLFCKMVVTAPSADGDVTLTSLYCRAFGEEAFTREVKRMRSDGPVTVHASQDLWKAVSKIAVDALRLNSPQFSRSQALAWAVPCDPIEPAIAIGALVVETIGAEQYLRFAHGTIQDYFAAQAVVDAIGKGFDLAAGSVISADWLDEHKYSLSDSFWTFVGGLIGMAHSSQKAQLCWTLRDHWFLGPLTANGDADLLLWLSMSEEGRLYEFLNDPRPVPGPRSFSTAEAVRSVCTLLQNHLKDVTPYKPIVVDFLLSGRFPLFVSEVLLTHDGIHHLRDIEDTNSRGWHEVCLLRGLGPAALSRSSEGFVRKCLVQPRDDWRRVAAVTALQRLGSGILLEGQWPIVWLRGELRSLLSLTSDNALRALSCCPRAALRCPWLRSIFETLSRYPCGSDARVERAILELLAACGPTLVGLFKDVPWASEYILSRIGSPDRALRRAALACVSRLGISHDWFGPITSRLSSAITCEAVPQLPLEAVADIADCLLSLGVEVELERTPLVNMPSEISGTEMVAFLRSQPLLSRPLRNSSWFDATVLSRILCSDPCSYLDVCNVLKKPIEECALPRLSALSTPDIRAPLLQNVSHWPVAMLQSAALSDVTSAIISDCLMGPDLFLSSTAVYTLSSFGPSALQVPWVPELLSRCLSNLIKNSTLETHVAEVIRSFGPAVVHAIPGVVEWAAGALWDPTRDPVTRELLTDFVSRAVLDGVWSGKEVPSALATPHVLLRCMSEPKARVIVADSMVTVRCPSGESCHWSFRDDVLSNLSLAESLRYLRVDFRAYTEDISELLLRISSSPVTAPFAAGAYLETCKTLVKVVKHQPPSVRGETLGRWVSAGVIAWLCKLLPCVPAAVDITEVTLLPAPTVDSVSAITVAASELLSYIASPFNVPSWPSDYFDPNASESYPHADELFAFIPHISAPIPVSSDDSVPHWCHLIGSLLCWFRGNRYLDERHKAVLNCASLLLPRVCALLQTQVSEYRCWAFLQNSSLSTALYDADHPFRSGPNPIQCDAQAWRKYVQPRVVDALLSANGVLRELATNVLKNAVNSPEVCIQLLALVDESEDRAMSVHHMLLQAGADAPIPHTLTAFKFHNCDHGTLW